MVFVIIALSILSFAASGVAAYNFWHLRRVRRWMAGHQQAQAILNEPPPPDDGRRRHLRIVAMIAAVSGAVGWLGRRIKEHPAATAGVALAAASTGLALLLVIRPDVEPTPPRALPAPTSPATTDLPSTSPPASPVTTTSAPEGSASVQGRTTHGRAPTGEAEDMSLAAPSVEPSTTATTQPSSASSTIYVTTTGAGGCRVHVEVRGVIRVCVPAAR